MPLDADDTLPQTAIAAIRNGFRKAPEADFIFGNGIKARMKFIYQYISIGEFKKAQELAQQMIKLLVSP